MTRSNDGTLQEGHDTEGSVVGTGTFLKLVPDGMIAHWRFGWAAPNLPTFSVPLVEVRVTLDEAGNTMTGLDLAFVCARDVYAEIESWGWFGLDQTQAESMGVAFADDAPVRVEVRLDPDYAPLVLTVTPDPNDPPGTLAQLLRPLLDPNVDGYVHQPSAFQWQRVVQETSEGVRGFDRTGRLVDAGIPDEPAASPRDSAESRGGHEAIASQKAYWVDPMTPGSLQLEGGPQIDLVVERVRYIEIPSGVPRIEVTFQLGFEDYLAAQFHGGLGITEDALAGEGFDDFDETLPVYVDARLDETVAREVFRSGEAPEQVLEAVTGALTDESSTSPLHSAGAWTFTAVQQQPKGQRFRIGFRNRNLS